MEIEQRIEIRQRFNGEREDEVLRIMMMLRSAHIREHKLYRDIIMRG